MLPAGHAIAVSRFVRPQWHLEGLTSFRGLNP